jgi:hypothetical protein
MHVLFLCREEQRDDSIPPTTCLQDTAMSTAIISPRRGSRTLVQNFVLGDTDLFVVESDLKLADQSDPRLDRDRRFTLFLQRQLTGYNSLDSPTNPQPTMTASLLRQFYITSFSTFDMTFCELFIGAFFFAMSSCEYIQVSGPRRTKLLTLKNINFFRGQRRLPHSDTNLHKADCISITFKLQKQDSKNDIITQHCSSNPLLCPVKIWEKIVKCAYAAINAC